MMKSCLSFPLLCLSLLALTTVSAGCGQQAKTTFSEVSSELGQAEPNRDKAQVQAGGGAAQVNQPPPDQKGKAPIAERKIIYQASIELHTENLDKAEKKLTELYEKHQGYLENSEIQGPVGSHRTGTWTIRIPVKAFNEFREAVKKLGEPIRNSVSSEDVTSRYFDIEGRIKAKLELKLKLSDHIAKSNDPKLTTELIEAWERALGDYEVLQGQLNRMKNQTSMTTVRVTIREREAYQPEEVAGFGTEISRTFSSSVAALTDCGQITVLFLVGIAPWLPIILLVVGSVWWLVRRAQKRKAGSTV